MKVRGLFSLKFMPPKQLTLNFYAQTIDHIIERLEQYYVPQDYVPQAARNVVPIEGARYVPDNPYTPLLNRYNEVIRVRAKASYAKYTNTALLAKNGYRCQFHPRYRRGMFSE